MALLRACVWTCALLCALLRVHGEELSVGVSGVVSTTSATAATTTMTRTDVILNDDYCDDLLGATDEPRTAACSYYAAYRLSPLPQTDVTSTPAVGFSCSVDGIRNDTISFSKVDDGVCDCCDGSDEPQIHCDNSCAQSQLAQRQQALARYRIVNSGVRSRNELIHRHVSMKTRESQSLATLTRERVELTNRLVSMEYLLQLERTREWELHWMLLHERLDACGQGFDDICQHLFASTFFSDRELEGEGIARRHLFHQRGRRVVSEHSLAERQALLSASGKERVLQGICPSRDLLPDPDSRIYTRLGDYLNHMERDGGLWQNRLRWPTNEDVSPEEVINNVKGKGKPIPRGPHGHELSQGVLFRKQHTLFGRFLENGERGHRRFLLCVCECLALLLSPVTLPMHAMSWSMHWLSARLWTDLKLLTALPQTSMATSSLGVHSWKLDCLTRIADAARFVVAMFEDEHSWQFAVYHNVFDIERLPGLIAYRDAAMIAFSPLLWLGDVLYHAPTVYIGMYLTNAEASLPPARHACLLREGIVTAQREIDRLTQRIHEEEQAQKLWTESERQTHRPAILSTQRFPRQQQQQQKTNGQSVMDSSSGEWELDLGVDGSWESMMSQCTSRLWPDREGGESEFPTTDSDAPQQYNYTLCLFDGIWQDRTLLGAYAHWGAQRLPQESTAVSWMTASLSSLSGSLMASPTDTHSKSQREDKKRTGAVNISERLLQTYLSNLRKQQADYERSSRSLLDEWQELFRSFESFPRVLHRLALDTLFATGQSIYRLIPAEIRAFLDSQRDVVAVSWWWRALASPLQHMLTNRLDQQIAALSSETRHSLLQQALHEYYSIQVYDSGDVCAVRPNFHRRTTVRFVCDSSFGIEDIQEIETCEYEMRVRCPLACTSFVEEQTLKALEELKVFGF